MQYPVGQFVNEAGLLGHVDELGGAGDAAVGFAPAQQRLDARRLEAVQRHLRLVHEQQVAGLDRAAQRLLRSEEHTSELQSQSNLVCRLLLEKKKNTETTYQRIHTHIDS